MGAGHRWSEGENGQRKVRIRHVGFLRAVPSAFAFIPPTATHIFQHHFRTDRPPLSASIHQKTQIPKTPNTLHLLSQRFIYVHRTTYRAIVLSRPPCAYFFLPCPWYSSSHDRIVLPITAIAPPKQQKQVMTGRGGAGNFRSPSCDRVSDGPEDYSDTRGRDPVPAGDPNAVRTFSTAPSALP